ncbi:chloramphenicol acetyltransferase [Vallitalea longa]|uniref:Chloramphenicol acetyltransferase n=1 Tax=Vallitalea longa TaxID=2936439 RepID=A0A9W5YF82_9FIRM|nr:chloramphenicol acetyltransferase [Vallitalea longa]GKX31208.1 chloramphenicol acetyltransferase [Vallitalea longa]
MKIIDIDTWKRKKHYNFFKKMDCPHYNVCANLDITKFYEYIKENNKPFTLSTIFAVTKAANNIKEFRHRIRDEVVVEHDIVKPAITVMGDDELFGFCKVDYYNDFESFRKNAEIKIKKAQENISVEEDSNEDDVLYLTSLPWVSFTGITHPSNIKNVDSIPRLGWGKYFVENDIMKLPFSILVHHALVDGIHVGKYFEMIQELMDHPDELFG